MITIPVITDANGSIRAAEPAPLEAICSITTPAGCYVYMPGDEDQLATVMSTTHIDGE